MMEITHSRPELFRNMLTIIAMKRPNSAMMNMEPILSRLVLVKYPYTDIAPKVPAAMKKVAVMLVAV